MTGGREEFPNVMEEGANDGLLIGPVAIGPGIQDQVVIQLYTFVSYDFS